MAAAGVVNKPYIIVTLGPTGSGKSSLITKTIEQLNLDSNYKKILIDDLIENNDKYKDFIKQIIIDVNNECREREIREGIKCDVKDYYLNPSQELLKKFNDAYYKVRTEKGYCDQIKSCDEINDEILHNAIKNNENIVFETTGTSIPKWLLSLPSIYEKYDIIFSYSIVDFNSLILRNTNRVIKSFMKFSRDPNNNPAPRLPDISKGKFGKIVSDIKNTLLLTYSDCVLNHNQQICGNQKINRLLLFNNIEEDGKRDMILEFDSQGNNMSVADFKTLVERLFNLQMYMKYIKYKTKYFNLLSQMD